ncbi:MULTISPECIES: hypothetical protein [Rhizobium]|uniref:Transcriptional regulator with XRE-family HTH domain n=1 Tax=Rhizobium esperanzae TaxID=1967781 RepID=A0A7W6XV99_9HYPH|nr:MULTISPECIES: hypothetical protein [Rhizobium]MBB4440243.1 transcriptional regulator with XRE-family HTH domain [Rhizobium esperanzae]MDF0663943.1 hypothetical protein [Rhizobium sp. BC49]MDH6202548.1 transcriptional regulator with XRE-family HTH domain [Rhizobium leguminosarum]
MSDLERGKRYPTIVMFHELARALEVGHVEFGRIDEPRQG